MTTFQGPQVNQARYSGPHTGGFAAGSNNYPMGATETPDMQSAHPGRWEGKRERPVIAGSMAMTLNSSVAFNRRPSH